MDTAEAEVTFKLEVQEFGSADGKREMEAVKLLHCKSVRTGEHRFPAAKATVKGNRAEAKGWPRP